MQPSNILVTIHGDKPVPKVIDFGMSKATQQRLTSKTLFTQFQQFIGTPGVPGAFRHAVTTTYVVAIF